MRYKQTYHGWKVFTLLCMCLVTISGGFSSVIMTSLTQLGLLWMATIADVKTS
jgi:hypothetical protein